MQCDELVKRYRYGAVSSTPLSIESIKNLFGQLACNLDSSKGYFGVTTADTPIPGRIAFLDRVPKENRDRLASDKFSEMLLVVPEDMAGCLNVAHIIAKVPREAYSLIVSKLFGYSGRLLSQGDPIDHFADVDPSAVLSAGVIVGRGSSIGARTQILPNVVIGANVRIGSDCLIKSGTIIGQPGFGVFTTEGRNLMHLPHVGGVVIEDDVELGSLNTVCSGTIHPTVIGKNVKVGDHVHIAHNCIIGDHSIITAGAVLSGSVHIGKWCWVGPKSSIRDGLNLGDRCFIGIGSNVLRSVPADAVFAGNPAKEVQTIKI